MGQSSIDRVGYDEGFFYKLYGGIRKKYYGFEGSYNRLAKFEVTGNNSGTIYSSGITGTGMIFIPLTDNFELFIKAGFLSWSATGEFNGAPLSNNKGTDLTYGGGMQYAITSKTTLRIEYVRFKDVVGGELTSVSTGFSYIF